MKSSNTKRKMSLDAFKDDLTHQSYKTEIVLEIKNNFNQPSLKSNQESNHVSQLERYLTYAKPEVSEIKIERQISNTSNEVVLPINEFKLNHDENPELVTKKTKQKVTYKQEVGIRYLRPPSPPPPGDLIVIQEKNIIEPTLPPLIIRQQPPRPVTPPPIIVRERPPTPPEHIKEQTIRIPGKHITLPRKVIVERLAELPKKPPAIIYEKWLPYEKQQRKVVFKKETDELCESTPTITQVIKPKNFVSRVQTTTELSSERYKSELMYQSSQSSMKARQIKDFGKISYDPLDYLQTTETSGTAKSKSQHETNCLKKRDFMESTSSSGIWSPANYPLCDDEEAMSNKRHSDFTYSFDDQNKHTNLMDLLTYHQPRSGKLNLEESDVLYMKIFKRFGNRCTERQAQEFSDCLNYNNTGLIDYESFKQEIINLLL